MVNTKKNNLLILRALKNNQLNDEHEGVHVENSKRSWADLVSGKYNSVTAS